MKKVETYLSKKGPKLTSELSCNDESLKADVELMDAKEGLQCHNPFGGLNIGIIEINKYSDHSTVKLDLVGYPNDNQWNPVTMFSTGEL
jgi:hypothetical protein